MSDGQPDNQKSQIRTKQLKDKLKRSWTKLTEDEINCYDEKRDVLIYIVQSKYKISKEQAEDALRYMERQYFEAA